MDPTENTITLPRPCETPFLIGHTKIVQLFKEAVARKRLHHAWLLSGPEGIGKATLSYHLARYLIKDGSKSESEGTFEVMPDDPLFRRVVSGAEGNLHVVRHTINTKGKDSNEFTVDSIRELVNFFELTAVRGGWRVAIIDCAEEMNRHAANALLKKLEEPPSRSLFLLISHAKGKLLPTIRSRCLQISLTPLSEIETATVLGRLLPELPKQDIGELSRLAEGSPGFAARLAAFEGLELYQFVKKCLQEERPPAEAIHEFALKHSKAEAENSYYLFLEILKRNLTKKMHALASMDTTRPELDCWLTLWDNVNRLALESEALHLSRRYTLMLILEDIAAARQGTLVAA